MASTIGPNYLDRYKLAEEGVPDETEISFQDPEKQIPKEFLGTFKVLKSVGKTLTDKDGTLFLDPYLNCDRQFTLNRKDDNSKKTEKSTQVTFELSLAKGSSLKSKTASFQFSNKYQVIEISPPPKK